MYHGVDFLKEHRASIDLENRHLHLAGQGGPVPLQEPPECSTSIIHKVCIVNKIEMPPNSELEVMARVDESVGEGTWLMEESTNVGLPVEVAQALMRTMTNRVPAHLLTQGQSRSHCMQEQKLQL